MIYAQIHILEPLRMYPLNKIIQTYFILVNIRVIYRHIGIQERKELLCNFQDFGIYQLISIQEFNAINIVVRSLLSLQSLDMKEQFILCLMLIVNVTKNTFQTLIDKIYAYICTSDICEFATTLENSFLKKNTRCRVLASL